MLTERTRGESGYSLVEVMASIIILTLAIIPMVGMFDMGLQSATRGSNYDKSRALANLKLVMTNVRKRMAERSYRAASPSVKDQTGRRTEH